MTTDPPPRCKWHLSRWFFVFAFVAMAWSGWLSYTFRSALAEAEALGWDVRYTDPVEAIRKDWKAVFEKATWLDGVTYMDIPTSEAFEQHLPIVHRLNPERMRIFNAATLRDLSALKPLTGLRYVVLDDCTGLTNVDGLKNLPALHHVTLLNGTGLTNVDALKNLSALQFVWLNGCTGLTNVDALKKLSSLQIVRLNRCTGLTPESIAALKAALPNAEITGP